jgi:hypothetical protein
MPTATRGDHVAPQVDFLGRKLDSARDVRFVWGDLCQAFNPDNIITNSDKARTDTCVLLLSTGNLNGSVKMLSLATWRIVTRDQWKVIPYDPTTIQMLTSRALKDEVSLSTKQREAYRAKDAVFRRVYQPLGTTHDYEEPPAMVLPTESPPVLHREAVVESPAEETQDRPSPVIDQSVSASTNTDDQRSVSTPAAAGISDSTPPPRIEQVKDVSEPPVPSHTAVPVPLAPPPAIAPSVVVPEVPVRPAPPAVDSAPPPAPVPRYNMRERKTPRITETMRPKSRKAATLLASNRPRRAMSFATRARFYAHSKRAHSFATQKKDIISHITPRQALKKKYLRTAAIKSMLVEISGLVDKSCFEGVHVSTLTDSQTKKIIRSSMFLKEKYKADGEFEKLKARLVAGGHMQDRSEMGDVSSPACRVDNQCEHAGCYCCEGTQTCSVCRHRFRLS